MSRQSGGDGTHQQTDLGSPARVISVTILIFLLSQIIIAPIIVWVGYRIFYSGHPVNFNSSIIAQFFFILIAEATIAFFAIMDVRRRNLSLAFIGLGRRPILDDVAKAAIGFGIFYLFLIVAGLLVSIFSPDLTNQKQNIGFDNINTNSEEYLALFSLVILPPLGEEILMRGYLYSGLRKHWRFLPALLVTSLFFGLAHLEFGQGTPLVWAAGIDTFLLSIVLVYLRERTGALYAGMLVHMLNNLLAFFVVIK